MSRSRKRTPVIKLACTPGAKRDANQLVRRSTDIPSGGAYRKIFSSWDICDYRCYWPEGGWKARRK